MKKILLIATLALVAACLSAKSFTGKVDKIIDGDTFWLVNESGRQKIRIWGVNCPELHKRGFESAKAFLSRLIYKKQVRLIIAQTHKSYGRPVCKVYRGGVYINLVIIQSGLGLWSHKFAPKEKAFKIAQRNARRNKVGLWSDKKLK